MTATPLWVPIASAAAALIGGGFGAMLQGRYGVSGWRRQIRLEAYVAFVNAAHDFADRSWAALDVFGESDFQDKWGTAHEAEFAMGRASSLVIIAGPSSVGEEALRTISFARLFLEVGDNDPSALSSMAGLRKSGRRPQEYHDFAKCAVNFAEISRKILKTNSLG
jgi:hypothetical protein